MCVSSNLNRLLPPSFEEFELQKSVKQKAAPFLRRRGASLPDLQFSSGNRVEVEQILQEVDALRVRGELLKAIEKVDSFLSKRATSVQEKAELVWEKAASYNGLGMLEESIHLVNRFLSIHKLQPITRAKLVITQCEAYMRLDKAEAVIVSIGQLIHWGDIPTAMQVELALIKADAYSKCRHFASVIETVKPFIDDTTLSFQLKARFVEMSLSIKARIAILSAKENYRNNKFHNTISLLKPFAECEDIPLRADIVRLMAYAYIRENRLDEVIQTVRPLLELDGLYQKVKLEVLADLARLLGHAYDIGHQFQDAIDLIEPFIGCMSLDAQLMAELTRLLSYAYNMSGIYEKALPLLEKCLEDSRLDLEYRAGLAKLYGQACSMLNCPYDLICTLDQWVWCINLSIKNRVKLAVLEAFAFYQLGNLSGVLNIVEHFLPSQEISSRARRKLFLLKVVVCNQCSSLKMKRRTPNFPKEDREFSMSPLCQRLKDKINFNRKWKIFSAPRYPIPEELKARTNRK